MPSTQPVTDSLERLLGKQALEFEFLKGALKVEGGYPMAFESEEAPTLCPRLPEPQPL